MLVRVRSMVVTMGVTGRSDPSRATVRPSASGASAGSPRGDQRARTSAELITAGQVRQLLKVDRSTVYRMAEDGRLPAIKVGRQWRFPAAGIRAVLAGVATRVPQTTSTARAGAPVPQASLTGEDPGPAPGGSDINLDINLHTGLEISLELARPLLEVTGYLLSVMMLVADMQGCPLTPVANPCPWFQERSGDPDVMQACSAKWYAMAQDPDLNPRFRAGAFGVECAHAFVRSGNSLVGMVLAGGVAPGSTTVTDPSPTAAGLYRLTDDQRRAVLVTLPRVAAALSRTSPRPTPTG